MKKVQTIFNIVEHNNKGPFLISELQDLFDGDLVFPTAWQGMAFRPYVVGNFVQGLFGGVSYSDVPGQKGGYPISGGDPMDRLSMGLLRLSDAVIVGASTLRTEIDHVWTPEFITPEHSALWKKQRQHMGKAENWQPYNCFVTASGNINFDARVFDESDVTVLIFTTEAGAKTVKELASTHRDRLESDKELRFHTVVCKTATDENVDLYDMLKKFKDDWKVSTLLVEGGAVFYNNLERHGLVDEIFLTVAPKNVGGSKSDPRPVLSMATGSGYKPNESPLLKLLSMKQATNKVKVIATGPEQEVSFLYQRWRYLH